MFSKICRWVIAGLALILAIGYFVPFAKLFDVSMLSLTVGDYPEFISLVLLFCGTGISSAVFLVLFVYLIIPIIIALLALLSKNKTVAGIVNLFLGIIITALWALFIVALMAGATEILDIILDVAEEFIGYDDFSRNTSYVGGIFTSMYWIDIFSGIAIIVFSVLLMASKETAPAPARMMDGPVNPYGYNPAPATMNPTPAPAYNPAPVPTYNPTPAPAFNPAPVPTYNPAPAPAFNPAPVPTYNPTPAPAYNPAPAAGWFCASCGAKNESGRFCAKCGQLNITETAAAPVTPVAPAATGMLKSNLKPADDVSEPAGAAPSENMGFSKAGDL